MLNDQLENAFRTAISAAAIVQAWPEFLAAGKVIPFYVSGEKGKVQYPNISIELKESSTLHPRTFVSEGILNVTVETRPEDEEESTHEARCQCLFEMFARSASLVVAINETNTIHLYGFALIDTKRDIQAQDWVTCFSLKAGYGPVLSSVA